MPNQRNRQPKPKPSQHLPVAANKRPLLIEADAQNTLSDEFINDIGGVQVMSGLANQELDRDIPGTDRGDEIGKMAAAVQVFKDNAIEVKRLEAERKEAEARKAQERHQILLNMADEFDASVGGVVQSVSSASTEMQSSASGHPRYR